MGLIARTIEAAGVPTISMTSAWDITEAVVPPRSVFFHAPLGHTTGPAGDVDAQLSLVRAALNAGMTARRGEIVRLPMKWRDDPGWEERAYSPEHTETGPDGKPLRG